MPVQWRFSEIQPGDILGGSSCTWQGLLINFGTCSFVGNGLSHVMMVTNHLQFNRPVLCEATSQCDLPCIVQGRKVSGVQFHHIRERVIGYPGKIWWYRLRTPLNVMQRATLSAFCQSITGREYDWLGAARARHTVLATIEREIQGEDLRKLFCSETCAAGWETVGVLPNDMNASAWSPNRLGRYAVQTKITWPPVRYRKPRR